MGYARGRWGVTKWAHHNDIHVSANEGSYMRFVCNCGNPSADNPDAETNANLITAAVNSCISVNPDNPQAVAKSIKDMYRALELTKETVIRKTEEGYLITADALRAINKVLAKANDNHN